MSRGLQAGDDGLRWFSTPEIAGKGASADATVHFRYRLNVCNVREIPQAVEKAAKIAANKSLEGTGLTAGARRAAFGRAIGDYIANWIREQPEGIFRRGVPGTHGYQYAVTSSAWPGTGPTVTGISGAGAADAAAALANASDEAAEIAARAKWGNRVRFAGRVGGRLLIIVGVGNSAYEVYTAENKPREVTRQIGGWTAACVGAKYGAIAGAATGATIAGVGGQAGP